MKRFLLLCVALAFAGAAAGCATPTGDTASRMDIPAPTVSLGDQSLSEVYPGTPIGGVSWHGFAATKYYFVKGGRQPTLEGVADDLERENPRVFKSHYSRTQFVTAMQMRLGTEFGSAGKVAALLRSAHVRTVSCEGTMRMMAYNGASAYTWIERSCVPGEQVVQVRLGDTWVDLFSLGCLNPVDGKVALITPDPCPQVWENPRGPAEHGRQMVVFVPGEAKACLPPTLTCAHECEEWAWGRRGRPNDPAIKDGLLEIMRSGGGAYYLERGMSGIRLPADLSVEPIWCDRDFHGDQDAEFMEDIRHDPRSALLGG